MIRVEFVPWPHSKHSYFKSAFPIEMNGPAIKPFQQTHPHPPPTSTHAQKAALVYILARNSITLQNIIHDLIQLERFPSLLYTIQLNGCCAAPCVVPDFSTKGQYKTVYIKQTDSNTIHWEVLPLQFINMTLILVTLRLGKRIYAWMTKFNLM